MTLLHSIMPLLNRRAGPRTLCRVGCLLWLLLWSACGLRYGSCDELDASLVGRLPRTLSQTGLFADLASETLVDGVLVYRPQFPLWSDGAQKRRWLWLPPDTQIDSRDMDAWRFPVGTKLWKEFVRDGVRVETRLLTKLGARDEDWIGVAYVWRADQSDADLEPDGVSDAQGTPHDVPRAAECMGCHGGRQSRVLGVAALQLTVPALPGEVSLTELAQRGLLSDPPSSYRIPGNQAQRAALGYLYANCSHCHNATRPSHDGARCYDPRNELDFSLRVHELASVAETGAYRTGRQRAFAPGEPSHSEMVSLMEKRGAGLHMPPLGSEQVDTQGVQTIRTWIEQL